MTERTTVRLPQELLKRAKRKAAAEGRTLTSLIAAGLQLVIADTPRPARAKRTLPPVSNATGGLVPGIELTDFSAIEEMDDVERVRRMKRFR
jgi:hypothetical protein